METHTKEKLTLFANQSPAQTSQQQKEQHSGKLTYESLFLQQKASATPEILDAHVVMLYKTLLS